MTLAKVYNRLYTHMHFGYWWVLPRLFCFLFYYIWFAKSLFFLCHWMHIFNFSFSSVASVVVSFIIHLMLFFFFSVEKNMLKNSSRYRREKHFEWHQKCNKTRMMADYTQREFILEVFHFLWIPECHFSFSTIEVKNSFTEKFIFNLAPS